MHGEKINPCTFLVGKTKGKEPHRRPKQRREDNNKINSMEGVD
jgi:hypothetical protein